MRSVKDVFTAYKSAVSGLYSVNEAEAITLLAITTVTGLSKAKIKAFPEMELQAQHSAQLDAILKQLLTSKPIQYILGETEFYGLIFKVNSSVLIPRPETEELVEWTISEAGNGKINDGSILDIGTGSGCIAISLKKNLPVCQVSAIDVSSKALEIAKDNAELNQVEINFVEADILDSNKLSQISSLISNISIIISNPPYVTLHDKIQMHSNVIDFEPHMALFVLENDSLIFYRAIADFALKNLVPGGLLFFEINENYGEQIVALLANKLFKNIELRKDMSGRDRMIRATYC